MRVQAVVMAVLVVGCVTPDDKPDLGVETTELSSPNDGRWPDHKIPFCITHELWESSGFDWCALRRGIASLSANGADAVINIPSCPDMPVRGITPLVFEELNNCPDPADVVHIEYRPGTAWHTEDEDPTRIHINLVANKVEEKEVAHETAHALGFEHEIRRPDAESSVTRYLSCAKSQDDPHDDHDSWDNQVSQISMSLLTPYDTSSVMQLSSGFFSNVEGESHSSSDGRVNLTDADCATVNARVALHLSDAVKGNPCPFTLAIDANHSYCTAAGNIHGHSFITGPNPPGWDGEDVNGAYQIYEPKTFPCQSNLALGSALASGDFDGDGYDDLAVGANGSVQLYKGTFNGLVAWRTITPTDVSLTSGAEHFGAALAAGKHWTTNASASLVIGAPTATGGAVFVFDPAQPHYLPDATPGTYRYVWPSTGPEYTYRINAPTGAKNFGRVVRVGTMNAPMIVVASDVTSTTLGQVAMFSFGDTTSSVPPLRSQVASDGFGASLAFGDIDNDGREELAVGAPNASGGAGAVYLYRNSSSSLLVATIPVTESTVSSGGHFGTAIGMANHKLAIGAPGDRRVFTFTKTASSTFGVERTYTNIRTQVDGFGTAIRLGVESGQNLMFVGSNGSVFAYVNNIYDGHEITAHAPPSDPIQTFGGFGTTLAIGDFDGNSDTKRLTDLVIGAPAASVAPSLANGGAFVASYNMWPGTALVAAQRYPTQTRTFTCYRDPYSVVPPLAPSPAP